MEHSAKAFQQSQDAERSSAELARETPDAPATPAATPAVEPDKK